MGQEVTVKADVSHFYNSVSSKLSIISELNHPKNQRAEAEYLAPLKKTLYLTFIDRLAKIYSLASESNTQHIGNRTRFINFLQCSSVWESGALISIPILKERLTHAKNPEKYIKIVKHLDRHIDNIVPNTPGAGMWKIENIDLHQDEIPIDNKSLKKEIDKAQHFSVFYSYRNFLIHEAAEPNIGMDYMAFDHEAPSYHNFDNDPALLLVYPLGFFKMISFAGLEFLADFLKDRKLNPYDLWKECFESFAVQSFVVGLINVIASLTYCYDRKNHTDLPT